LASISIFSPKIATRINYLFVILYQQSRLNVQPFNKPAFFFKEALAISIPG